MPAEWLLIRAGFDPTRIQGLEMVRGAEFHVHVAPAAHFGRDAAFNGFCLMAQSSASCCLGTQHWLLHTRYLDK